MKRLALLSALILAPLSASAVEYPIEIVNGDFELAGIIPPIPPGSFEFAEFDVPPGSPDGYFNFQLPLTVPGTAVSFGWELHVHGTDAEALTDVFDFAVPILSPAPNAQFNPGEYDGHVGGIYIADDAGVSSATLWQTTAHNLLPDTRYRMSVDIGNIQTSGPLLNFNGFPGYFVAIGAANQKLAADENSVIIEEGDFETVVITVDTPSAAELSSTNQLGQPVFIFLTNQNLPHPDAPDGDIPANEVNFDNITLTYESLKDIAIAEEEAGADSPSPPVRKPVKTRGRLRSDFKSIR
jgi:hypothetical protein